MIVSILGCGWLGLALGKELVTQGISVKGSTTSNEKLTLLEDAHVKGYLLKVDDHIDLNSDFWNCDVLIIASNVKLVQNPGYLEGLKKLAAYIENQEDKRVIFLSSTSVYGEPNATINEDAAPAPITPSAIQLLALEDLFKFHSNAMVVRLAGLVGPGRMPGSFFAGKKNVPNGLTPINLIHMYDCIGICKLLLNHPNPPKYLNAVAPEHPTKSSFYQAAALRQGLPLPEFLNEKLDWKIVNSRYIDSLGYRFVVDNLTTWINGNLH